MVDIIKKKRNGLELTQSDIEHFIKGLINGKIPDYQVSALLMAIYFQGCNSKETAMLTYEMMQSGALIDLSEIDGVKVDKHSTGGVGDKTTLVLAPLVAAAGVPVAKMSGRGLGHTGGTLDKLESIEGLKVDMSSKDFIAKIKQHGIAVCGQNTELVPADKKIYALRDVTATVDNVSLIASSVMSKKLACGADSIVIDIKIGDGAYMKNVEQASKLAEMISGIAAEMNREVVSVITAMHEPLGYAVGNSIEVIEAINTLKGKGPSDLTELCFELGAHMLVLGKVAEDHEQAITILKKLIDSGKAYDKFVEFVKAQEGNLEMIENVELLPQSQHSVSVLSSKEGYINHLSAMDIGLASMKLGAGRATKNSPIDHGAGILLKKKIGDFVEKDEELAVMYSNNQANFAEAEELIMNAYQYGNEKPPSPKLILKTIK